MDVTLRRAEPRDAGGITDALFSVESFGRLREEGHEVVVARIERFLASCQVGDDHLVLVAEDEHGQIQGYSSVHFLHYLILTGPEGMVSELFIHSRARGQGIGTLLIEEVKREGLRRGCSRLMLLNDRERESYRRGFYAKNGWIEREDMANFVFKFQ